MELHNVGFQVALMALLSATARGQCGGNLTATATGQELTSPNYPHNHRNNLNCWWYISSPYRQVLFTITDLDTEVCCDYIEVYDGSVKIGRYRGHQASNIVIASSQTNTLRIRFFTDSSVVNTGFRATYRETSNCGHVLNATPSMSHFSTPHYPGAHPHNLDCFWAVIPPSPTHKVQVTILEGETETCCDYIDVIQDGETTARIKGMITGPRTFTSRRGQSIGIFFRSNGAIARDGFRASYKEFECGGRYLLVDNAVHILTTPNYPNHTDHNLDCNYVIQAQPGYTLELTLEVHTERCCDYVQIFDGTKSVGRIQGDEKKSTFVSTSRSVRLFYHTDSSVGSRGFNVSYKQLQPGCGREHKATGSYQTITSPGFPENYGNDVVCDWSIGAPAGSQVVLTITELATETCCDYLEVFDGLLSLGRYKGSISNANIVSKSGGLRLRFFTDDSTRKKGFTGKYKIANNCGTSLTASRGREFQIGTPNYPNDHADNLDCMWTITATDHTQVQLNITAGETEEEFDFIQVIDNLMPLATLDGKLSFRSFTSTGSVMRVFFHSDDAATRDGFTGMYKNVCQKTYNVTSTSPITLSSPNYPRDSPHGYDCHYIFQTMPGRRIEIIIVDVETESCCDFVKIYNGSDIAGTYRGRVPVPQTVTSTGNTMRLYFHTDGSVGSKGFRITYSQA